MKAFNTKISIFLLFGLVFQLFFACSEKVQEETASEVPSVDFVNQSFEAAKPLYVNLLKETEGNFEDYPHAVNADGSIKYLQIDEWTGGFWPGILWYMYEYTGDEQWKNAALDWTHSLESNQFNTSHHDIGFMMFCSYGNALRFEKNKAYDQILIESAKSLLKRYSPIVGSIQSWNKRKSKGEINTWEFPVIMDNMMNLELLCYVTEITGDSTYYDVAVKHATQTMRNHIREDFSTYHVVNYDPKNGEVLHQQTLQGFSDNSTWARGQAWGIYGFTTMYRATQDKQFLETAIGLADFFLDHPKLPEDFIPVWDFNVGEDGFVPDWHFDPSLFDKQPRDASAAAITASALLALSTYVDGEQKQKYFDAAENMLKSLSSDTYLNSGEANPYFLLKHSTGNLPSGNEVDVPLIYADYYFLEALLRYKKMKG
ncbi:glycoside hydrolase family 88 protein [Belliella sp. DSM 111904]|uniref:Glycoside hydrolase family 88 protein n=1 Tax=Belliella filtrata TaxID=2923435 RepID=A0ABS9UYH7_9BACT|nr:glycoside hydrolase family 88 protein [Belliella filtrata]MCH7409174.1 glycoside hydrolase family 88 protein [Belliella filtrata]